MLSPAPSNESPAPTNIRSTNDIFKQVGVQRTQPVAEEPAGLVPKRPNDGWTYAKVPGSIWTAFELDYMNLNLPMYRERKGKDRENLVRWVKKEIHTKWGARYNNVARENPKINKEWRKRKKSISDWFRNHGRSLTEIRIPHWTGKATFKQVMAVKKRAEILALTDELSHGAKRGDAEGKWIKHYQLAMKQIREGLTDEEVADIHSEMEHWDSSNVPELQQAKQAASRGGKTIRSLHRMAFKTMGMRCITLTMHYDIAGMPVYGIADHNDSFIKKDAGRVKALKAWRPAVYGQLNSIWADYISDVIVPAEKPELLDEDIRERLPPPKPAIRIEHLANGHYLVPNAHETENQANRTSILRQFMNAEYKLASGGGARSVPWLRFEKHISEFLNVKYIPGDVSVKDPEKMTGNDRHRLLEHWRHRQAMGKIRLKFKAIYEKDQMIESRYKEGMKKPPATSCLPLHVPVPDNDTVPDSTGPVEEDKDDSDDSSGYSSAADDVPLPTPAPTSPAPPIAVVDDSGETSDEIPVPKKRGRPRGAVGQRAKTTGKGRGKRGPTGGTPVPGPSMLTPEGTPVPAPKKAPRPKPKPKAKDKGALQRELHELGVAVDAVDEADETNTGRRRSPRKPVT